jgi:hypothetical protein
MMHGAYNFKRNNFTCFVRTWILVSGIRGIAWAKFGRELCAEKYIRPKREMWQEAGQYCTMNSFII